jgi:hypothetical protein
MDVRLHGRLHHTKTQSARRGVSIDEIARITRIYPPIPDPVTPA